MPGVIVVTDDEKKEDVFNAATASLACSGSVTTELALQGTPMVIGYRLGQITYFIAKNFLFRGTYVTLLNVASNKEIVPEFLQDKCTPETLAPAVLKLLTDPAARARQVAEQNAALEAMGRGKTPAAEIAAGVVLSQALNA